jgi:hypothetical protein
VRGNCGENGTRSEEKLRRKRSEECGETSGKEERGVWREVVPSSMSERKTQARYFKYIYQGE